MKTIKENNNVEAYCPPGIQELESHHFQRIICYPYKTLVKVFGNEDWAGIGEVSQIKWFINTPDGWACMYDYKARGTKSRQTLWRVSGLNEKVVVWIESAIKNYHND